MARRLSLSFSDSRPFLLKTRSAPRFILLVACYGIFTVSERLSVTIHYFEDSQLIWTIVEHLFFYGMVSSLWTHFVISFTHTSQLIPVTPTALIQRAGVPPKESTLSYCHAVAYIPRIVY